MPVNDMVIRIGGESGEGIVTIGEIFVRIAAFSGLEVYTFRTFPAEIKGGQVTFQARIADTRVLSQGDRVDVLVAMDQKSFVSHIHELKEGGVLVVDSSRVQMGETVAEKFTVYRLPVDDIVKQIDFKPGRNIVMLGALVHIFGLPLERAEEIVKRRLKRFPDMLAKNMEAMEVGHRFARDICKARPPVYLIPPDDSEERLVLTGNQAIAMGAIAAGCRFFAGYPITPATDIMEFLAGELPRVGGALVQAEDEIAAINMAIGASFAGERAMTATSGPGLALMIESLCLASMTETPVVIVDVQRAGPSTGMPTKTSQGDLFMAFYAGGDEAPRFVVAPSSVEDCFYQTINAFNLAERFQMPVIILSDQALAPRVETCKPFDLSGIEIMDRERPDLKEGVEYRRYELTESGVSPMAVPGMKGGEHTAEGLEHNELGNPNYAPEMHTVMTDKRFQKVDGAREQLTLWSNVNEEWGDEDAALGIIGWGSSLGPVREAMARARAEGLKVAALFPKVLLPMPDLVIRRFIQGRRAIIMPELNHRGQFGRIVEHRYHHDLIFGGIQTFQLNKYMGLPFRPVEIYEQIVEAYEAMMKRRVDTRRIVR